MVYFDHEDSIIGFDFNCDGEIDRMDDLMFDDYMQQEEREREEEEEAEAEREADELHERYEAYLEEHDLDEEDLDEDTFEDEIDDGI